MSTWSRLSYKQPLVSQILQNSIKQRRVSHAYLLHGLRGTGKRTLATLFVKTLLCQNKEGIEPCHQCNICRRIVSKNHPDVHWIKPDGQSIKNEQIDALRREFSYHGLESQRKIYIITHAETLTTNAANRLLKFLEEPSTKMTAILLTENKQAIIPTIRSRCQILDLKPLNKDDFRKQLKKEKIDKQNRYLLSALTNDVKEAIQLHEKQEIYEIKTQVEQFINVLMHEKHGRFLFIHKDWLSRLNEREQLTLGIQLLSIAFKDIIYAQVDLYQLISFFKRDSRLLKQSVNFFSQKRLLHILKVLSNAEQQLKQHGHPTLVMEQLVLKI